MSAEPVLERLQDRYDVLSVLGEGALGRTMRAHDTRRGATVAIKELLPSRMKNWKDFELFEREARLLEKLDHPGVVAYRDHFEVREGPTPRLFLVQELLTGGTLEEELVERGVYDELQARALAAEVLETLAYLHGRPEPVLHRDIKPSNLMRRADGSVVLIDFGAVHEVLDASAEGGGSTMVGTFGYMPPEQYAGEAWPQTDLFALGATLVHLLTGRSPDTLFGRVFEIELPPDLSLSPGFEQWLRRMIDPDRDRRFTSAREALAVLESGILMSALARPEALALLPNDPGPTPRREVGYLLREPATGTSLALRLGIQFGLVAAAATSSAYFAILGSALWAAMALFLPGAVLLMSGRVVSSWWRARTLYRDGTWVVGEVTDVLRPVDGDGGLNERRLVYRYLVGRRLHRGALVTRDRRLASLRPGDPVGVIYDPSRVSDSMLFWS